MLNDVFQINLRNLSVGLNAILTLPSPAPGEVRPRDERVCGEQARRQRTPIC